MAANLLVRRSTARLLCLARFQVASFFTERPEPTFPSPNSSPVITTYSDEVAKEADPEPARYWKTCNLLKDCRPFSEILATDRVWKLFYHPTQREKAMEDLGYYWRILKTFHHRLAIILFKEHLVKHCSHRKVQMGEALKFKKAFKLPYNQWVTGQAEQFYNETVEYRNKRKLPKSYKATLLKELEEPKEKLRENRELIEDEIMIETEEDAAMQFYNETVEYRNKRKLPKAYKATLLKELEESKEKLREENRELIEDEVMIEIEEDATMQIFHEIVEYRNKRKLSKADKATLKELEESKEQLRGEIGTLRDDLCVKEMLEEDIMKKVNRDTIPKGHPRVWSR